MCTESTCNYYQIIFDRLQELEMPITTEEQGNVIALIQNHKVIGEIPSTAFPIILDAFNQQL